MAMVVGNVSSAPMKFVIVVHALRLAVEVQVQKAAARKCHSSCELPSASMDFDEGVHVTM